MAPPIEKRWILSRAVVPLWLVLAAPLLADKYVGSRACAVCHKAIYDSYQATAMGRSMSVVSVNAQPDSAVVSSPELKREFRVVREGAQLYQIQSEPGVFETKRALAYAIGSGVNGMSYVVRSGDGLFQAPLSYYSRTEKWDLSPGYEHADHGFSRPILPACIACHSGRPQPIADRQGLFRDPPFDELAIGCENCHGPGEAHIAGGTKAIVNPAKLERRLAEDICMNCHQTGDTRVPLPGREVTDFRPGQPLSATLIIAKLTGKQNNEDLLEHHSAMQESVCFTASKGKLSCLTCHDPHRQIKGAAATSWYRSKCLTCHKDDSCTVPAPTRLTSNGNDCKACHMPSREAATISHSALTNHRIVRKPGSIRSAPATPKEPVEFFNVRDGSRIHPVTMLQIYGELLAKEPSLQERYLSLLNQLSQTEPDSDVVQAALGRRALLSGSAAEALDHLKKAESLGYSAHTLYVDMAEALSQSGKLQEAANVLAKATARDPYAPNLHKSLVLRYIALKEYDAARSAMKRYLELFPHDSFMRGLLAKVAQ